MNQDYVECSELSGKTIQKLRIYKDGGDGTEIQIDLTDGTTFSCCVSHPPAVTASLYQGGVGKPKVLRDYGL
jgi:hypothetical protein